jgi:hypothetical protein
MLQKSYVGVLTGGGFLLTSSSAHDFGWGREATKGAAVSKKNFKKSIDELK